MSPGRAVWAVARRELVERSRSRAVRTTVVILLIVSVGGAVAAARLSGGGPPSDTVGVVGARTAALAPMLRAQAQAAGRRVRLRQLSGLTAASRALHDGTVDVVIVDGRRLMVESSRTQAGVRVAEAAIAAQAIADRLRGTGLSEQQLAGALARPAVPVDVLHPDTATVTHNRDLLYIALLVLFIALTQFAQTVASSVTEEKASRVVELLLTTLSPRRLLGGKILGVGLLGLALLALAGGSALLAGELAGGAGLPSAAPEAVALVLLWFVLGYAFYSVAFAAVGALVSRQEDLQVAILPVTALLIGAYVVGVIVLQDPNGIVATVAAFVPPVAPMAVPARMVLGDMTAAGLIGAVAIDVLATAALVVLAARVYERAILQIGAPLKLRRALRGAWPATTPAGQADAGPAPTRVVDLVMRAVAVILMVAGAALGLSTAAGLALVALGLVAIVLAELRKRHPRRPVH